MPAFNPDNQPIYDIGDDVEVTKGQLIPGSQVYLDPGKKGKVKAAYASSTKTTMLYDVLFEDGTHAIAIEEDDITLATKTTSSESAT